MPQIMTDWHSMRDRLLKKLAANTERMNRLESERQKIIRELERVQADMAKAVR